MKPISGKRLCKLLKSRGWTLDHISGSHYVYTHPDAPRPIPVPVHGIGIFAPELSDPSCEKRASQTTISNSTAAVIRGSAS
jgi:predicted RNA binding protein YcfA (HicA-like mRNA interferase family)